MKKIISLILVSLVGIAATFAIDHSELYTTKVGYGEELYAKMKEQYDVIEYTSISAIFYFDSPATKAMTEGLSEEEKKELQQKDAMGYQKALEQAIAENKVLIVKQPSITKLAEKQNTYTTTNPTDDISISCQKNKPLLAIHTDECISYEFRNLPEMKDTDYFKLCREIKANKVKKTYKITEAGKQKQKEDAAARLPETVVTLGISTIIGILTGL